MNVLCSEGHEIYGVHVNKISLSPFDPKRFIAENGIDTFAYGYWLTEAELDAYVMDFLEAIQSKEVQPTIPPVRTLVWVHPANNITSRKVDFRARTRDP